MYVTTEAVVRSMVHMQIEYRIMGGMAIVVTPGTGRKCQRTRSSDEVDTVPKLQACSSAYMQQLTGGAVHFTVALQARCRRLTYKFDFKIWSY